MSFVFANKVGCKLIIFWLLAICSYSDLFAQTENDKNNKDSLFFSDDNVKKNAPVDSAKRTKMLELSSKTTKSSMKASLLSLALPGLGQIYNGKYWKVPIIYGTFGFILYLAQYNNKQYKRFLDNYVALNDGDPNTIDEFNGKVRSETILFYKDRFRRDRDFDYILFGVAYLMNVIDASVDAHFSKYSMSEDLSLQFSPALLPVNSYSYAMGFRVSIRF